MNQLRQIQDMGCHIVLDFSNVQNVDLSDVSAIQSIFSKALSRTDCNVVSQKAKVFEDGQVSMIYLLSESHMSYHAWPSEKSVTIDFYNCGANSRRNCVNFEEVLCDAFGWENCTCTMTLPRGKEAKLIINDYSHKLDIFKGLNLIFRTKSQKHQDIRVYNSLKGKVLTIDGKIQMTSEYRNTYAYDMCSPIISQEQKYQNVLVIGGGDLQIARHLCEYPNVEKITVVELDETVMKVCEEHFPELDLSEPMKSKIQVEINDGYQFLKEREGQEVFDAIIVEYTDNNNDNSSKLQPKDFYETLLLCLKPGSSFCQLLGSDDQTHQFLKTIENSSGFGCDVDFFYTSQLGGQKQVGVVHQQIKKHSKESNFDN